ncbi:hypothetical protein SAMN02745674_01351 [Lysobacter spongiicola DSM 21749]|uniref:Lipoprotein n=2 Tax=Novilysobacter TaxID=3382699 RepID=A0A1T4PRI0_9GAMM|nr:hypothetical protein SAMN02745674_01351 [Lysobacter spongiicola DSM 21749]
MSRALSYRGGLGALAIIAATMAVGCTGPLDGRLVTGKGLDAYRTSLAPMSEATEFEREAFDWAVSDFDVDRVHREYPDSTPRKIIRAEVGKVRETYPKRIEALEAEAEAQEPLREELRKVTATDARFFLDKNFFGQQPKVTASISNGSSLPVSSLSWQASLYVNDGAEAVATSILSNDYRRDGGLKPGDAYTVTFTVGFVTGDERWTTLEIRNANSTRVVLEPIIGSIKDFGNRPYLATDASAQASSLRATLEAAEKYAEI